MTFGDQAAVWAGHTGAAVLEVGTGGDSGSWLEGRGCGMQGCSPQLLKPFAGVEPQMKP